MAQSWTGILYMGTGSTGPTGPTGSTGPTGPTGLQGASLVNLVAGPFVTLTSSNSLITAAGSVQTGWAYTTESYDNGCIFATIPATMTGTYIQIMLTNTQGNSNNGFYSVYVEATGTGFVRSMLNSALGNSGSFVFNPAISNQIFLSYVSGVLVAKVNNTAITLSAYQTITGPFFGQVQFYQSSGTIVKSIELLPIVGGPTGYTGNTGTTGPTGFLSITGTNYGDYVYWNGSVWAAGSQQVVIGGQAGQTGQKAYGIAIGYQAATTNQGTGAVAIGYQAGFTGQSTYSVAIGTQAGQYGLGSNSVAIGYLAGPTGAAYSNNIILNAAGTGLNPNTGSAFYVAPIRNTVGSTSIADTSNVLFYNATTKEITYAPKSLTNNIQTEQFMVAVGYGATNTLAYSYDGINWTSLGTSVFSTTGNAVAWNGSLWIAGGDGTNTLAYSSDGINWTGVGTSVFNAYGNGVAWNGTLWVAVGGDDDGANTLAYSSDGINWIGLGKSIFSTVGYGVAWNGSLLVAVGGGPNTLAYSSDGINWTGLGESVFSTFGNGVAWNGSLWIASGSGTNTLAYSYDGINWTGLGTSDFSTDGYGVAWNGSLWVAGGAGTNTLAYSYDGINWTGIGTSIFSIAGYGVAWNGSLWVANGDGTTNTLAYSYDGINWTGLGTSLFSTYGLSIASRRVLPFVGNQQIPLQVRSNQAIAIGGGAGNSLQGTGSIAIGYQAGQYSLGSSSIAIGNLAGPTGLSYANTIVLNAKGTAVNPATGSALYVAPIRVSTDTSNVMVYNTITNEVTYNTGKTFIIDHPIESSKYLVHACLEGPEVGVYYRGKGIVPENATRTVITLPAYVPAFANNFTIQLTPIYTPGQPVSLYAASELIDNTFEVHGQPGSFYWLVHGSRGELMVEPLKSEVTVRGDGPYKYIL